MINVDIGFHQQDVKSGIRAGGFLRLVVAFSCLCATLLGSSAFGQEILAPTSYLKPNPLLLDPDNRVAPEFEIPPELLLRTAFWFNVYTEYGENDYVIHHSLYPWVIFKIINTDSFLSGQGPLWLRRQRASHYVRKQTQQIVSTLNSLSRRRTLTKLNPLEKELMDRIAELPGSRRRVLTVAARSVRNQLGQKDFFVHGLQSSSRYLPHIEKVFIEEGLPPEISRLPFVESSFNVKAESRVGAAGIWQIMPSIATSHHLFLTDKIDERLSPLKASRVAARMLRHNYRSLKSWPLTLTSYNHGIGGVMKVVRRTKTRDLPEIIKKYHAGSFRFASANFYTCFLAALYAEKYKSSVFLQLPSLDTLLIYKTIAVHKPIRARALAKALGIDLLTLQEYNLDIRRAVRQNSILPAHIKIFVPANAVQPSWSIGTRGRPLKNPLFSVMDASLSGSLRL